MTKALRITSVLAAGLAVVLIVFPAVFGVGSDEQKEKFLNTPGAVEMFRNDKGARAARRKNQISPLVEQAKAFALYLNPIKPKKEKKTRPARKTGRPRLDPKPGTVSAKFKLVGTSYYASHPELSLALIDMPGKGLRWVRQSGKVGHLVVEEVKNGLVVIRDGQRTYELSAQRKPKRSLLKGASSSETTSRAAAAISTGQRSPAVVKKTDVEATGAEPVYEKSLEEVEAEWQEVLAAIETLRVDTEEAKKLSNLGKVLKDKKAEKDPNQAGSTAVKKSSKVKENRAKKRIRSRKDRKR